MVREKIYIYISVVPLWLLKNHILVFYIKETFNFKMPLTQPRMDIPQYKDS